MVRSHSENIARLKLLDSIWSVIAFLAQFRLPWTRLSVILQFCAFLLIISRNGNYKRYSVSPTAVPSNPPPRSHPSLTRGHLASLEAPSPSPRSISRLHGKFFPAVWFPASFGQFFLHYRRRVERDGRNMRMEWVYDFLHLLPFQPGSELFHP